MRLHFALHIRLHKESQPSPTTAVGIRISNSARQVFTGAADGQKRRWHIGIPPLRAMFISAFRFAPGLLRDAKTVAARITWMSDLVFAALAENDMPITTQTAQNLLSTAARLEIEAAELARALAPGRTLADADYAQTPAVSPTPASDEKTCSVIWHIGISTGRPSASAKSTGRRTETPSTSRKIHIAPSRIAVESGRSFRAQKTKRPGRSSGVMLAIIASRSLTGSGIVYSEHLRRL